MSAALVCVLALGGCAAAPQTFGSRIVGVWRSDAPRTLASLNAMAGIPAQRRQALEDDYYGHLIVEYRADTVRAHFDNGSYDSGYRPYRVVEATPERIVTEEWNELLHEFERSTTYIDGKCIYGLAADYAYREYFCPLRPAP